MRWLALVALVFSGCGGRTNALTGDVQFSITGARALHDDAGAERVRVYLLDTNVGCIDLGTYDDFVDQGRMPPPPFGQAVELIYLRAGGDHRSIQTPFEAAAADQAGAGWLLADGGGTAAISGSIDLDGDRRSGRFDVLTVSAGDYVALSAGSLAPDGGPLMADGGALPTVHLAGTFSASDCP